MKKRPHLGQIKSYYNMMPAASSALCHHVENPNRILPSRQHSVLLEQCLRAAAAQNYSGMASYASAAIEDTDSAPQENRLQPTAMWQKMVKR